MTLAKYVQGFFVERLASQCDASPNTVNAYKHTMRMFLAFLSARLGQQPSAMKIEAINAETVSDFLGALEDARGNCARTRNARLTCLRSFFNYVAYKDPSLSWQCQRIVSIPSKRYERKVINYLDSGEIRALLAAPDRSQWIGRRDYAILLLALNTGLRVSEIIALTRQSVQLGASACVRSFGKGRKHRATPLRKDVAKEMTSWISELPADPLTPLFPARDKAKHLSRDAIEQIVRKHTRSASFTCPSLTEKRVSPHTLRHSAAMSLLSGGVDPAVIALVLGHESVGTTSIYIHEDMELKRKALDKARPMGSEDHGFRPDDKLLAFLESL